MGDSVFVVFNPFSGKGRGAALVRPVLDALQASGPVEHAFTQKAGDETRLAREAIARGASTIVAVGGDGTWSNVGNAIVASGKPVSLGLIAGGTGCDLAKSLAIPARDIRAAVRVIREGKPRAIDVGKIEDRYFLNIAGFGYDIAVIEDSWTVKWLQGDLVYLYCALRQLHRFRGFPVEVSVDGRPAGRMDLLMLVIANARIFGGTFAVAPQADLADGKLDTVAFHNMGVFGRLGTLTALVRGRHLRSKHVSVHLGSQLRLRFEKPPAYETDGEWNQAKSAEIAIETLPRALRVMAPA